MTTVLTENNQSVEDKPVAKLLQEVCQEESFPELPTESESCFEMSEINPCVQLEQGNDYEQLESEEDSQAMVSDDSCLEGQEVSTRQETNNNAHDQLLHSHDWMTGQSNHLLPTDSQRPLKEAESGTPFPAVGQSFMQNAQSIECFSDFNCDFQRQIVSALKAQLTDSKAKLNPSEINQFLKTHPFLSQLSQQIVELQQVLQQGLEDIRWQISNQNCAEVKDEMTTKPLMITHFNIKCNGCVAFSIRGKRWKCLRCPDFNLCNKCERKVTHQHPMLRFNDPLPNDMVERIGRLLHLRDRVEAMKFPELMNCILRNAAKLDYSPELHKVFVEKYRSVDFGEFMVNVYEIFF